jgi:microcystin-dependent protein
MAINFPNSPSNGDIFGNFTYDTSIPGWRKTPENSASLPAGTIVQWPGATAPANWLLADGAAVSRTTYASLFAAIGLQYGSGDGTTTFNLPNLKGRVAVGLDSSQTEFDVLGETGGAKTHTLTTAEMPSHTHIQDQHRHQVATNNAAEATTIGGYSPATMTMFFGTDRAGSIAYHATAMVNTTATNQNTGGGGAHNNLQPYIVLNYIIKTSAGVTSGDSELATRVGVVETQNNATPTSPNLIINGDMSIAQRGTSFSFGSGGGSRYYPADRFSVQDYTWSAGSNITVSNDSAVVPASSTGIYTSAKIATGAVGLTFGSAGYLGIRHVIEGQQLAPYLSRQLVLSFYVRSSVAGTYTLLMTNGNSGLSPAPTRIRQQEYSISSVDTWERKTIIVDMPTATSSGTWNKTNGYGLELIWNLGAHADRTSDTYKNTWGTYSSNYYQTTSSVQWATGANRTFYITGVQLETGTLATPFRRNSTSTQNELASCQRYYQRFSGVGGSDYTTIGTGQAQSNTLAHFMVPLYTAMRGLPALSYSSVSDWGAHRPGQTITTAASMSLNSGMSSTNMSYIYMTYGADGSYGSNVPCMLSARGSTTAWIGMDAEL